MKDAFYTPTHLAKKLISFIPEKKINRIVDFCVGDGELLRVAQERWRNANFYGTDISHTVIKQVKNLHPNWTLGRCDFLNERSRRNCYPFKCANNIFDLVLLNPPFSCIGSKVYLSTFNNINFTSGRAMAFVLEALKYIDFSGSVFAILPNSVMYSQKDEKVIKYLIKNYDLRLLEETGIRHFNDCSPHVVLVSINATVKAKKADATYSLKHNINGIQVHRGIVQMHALNETNVGDYLIHSTNLREGKVKDLLVRHKSQLSKIAGPAIFIPRVGTPNINKICLMKDLTTCVLSDCVIAIKTSSEADTLKLYSLIIKDWENFKKLYKGTGAKYTTMKKVKEYININ